MKIFNLKRVFGALLTVFLAALPVLVFGEDTAEAAPTLNSGDTAWMLTATALVLFMTIPGLSSKTLHLGDGNALYADFRECITYVI